MDLKLDDTSLQNLLGMAIVQAMDQQGKDTIIREAIKHLTEKKREGNSWDSRMVSPIETAFQYAVERAANKFAAEVVASPEFETQIRAVAQEAVANLFTEQSRKLIVSNIERGIHKAFGGDN
jgi:hypothetical protein